jgi:hypothetical protein
LPNVKGYKKQLSSEKERSKYQPTSTIAINNSPETGVPAYMIL